MKGPGWGNPSDPSAPQDAGLRETATNSIARWKRRLDQSAQLGIEPPLELALTEREARQLRELAFARGATQLASHLDRVVTACAGPPGALRQAVERLADHVRVLQSGPHPLVVAAPPAIIQPGPPAVEPVPPPRIHSMRSIPEPRIDPEQSIAEPPLLQLSQVGAKPRVGTKGEGTLLSAQDRDRAAQAPSPPAPIAPSPRPSAKPPTAQQVAPPRGRTSERPPSRDVDGPPALPSSLTPPPVAAPSLVGTFFGFRAFGRKPKGASKAGALPERGGVLGLQGRIEPIALPVGPAAGPLPKWAGARGGDAFEARRGRKREPTSSRASRESGIPKWSYLLSGSIGLLAIVTAAIIALAGRRSKEPVSPVPQATAPSAPATTAVPPARPEASEIAERLTATVHRRGAETPELRALLDMQGRLALACKNDPASCGRGWTPLARDSFNAVAPASVQVEGHSDTPLPAWLQRLKMPQDFPIRDDPVLRAHFDFNTKNIAGRQRLQAKLFECAAYEDIFDSTLVKYGAPAWLAAVVYQESDCNPRAMSEVGAKGLWQFMPESARAYGLRVVEGDVDERLNPIKSTEAAIHFLTDLQRKLGSWDLVLAAYNMGPFAVLARLSQVGDAAGFWDLAHAGVLPEETAQYVPAIQAYALVLQNLGKLQFSRDGKRLEGTSEIIVKPGTRLSLIARASSTTTLHVRELNPEFLRDVVPEGETTARVPDAEAHRAQAFFESWSPEDNRDTCVSEDFDWGAKQFDTSRFAKNCPRKDVSP